MTPRERMLAAYRGQLPDRVPVSPELWDATAIAVNGRPWQELIGPFAEVPWWRTHLGAFEHFDCDAWVVPGPGATPAQSRICSTESRSIDAETIETRKTWSLRGGSLHAVSRTTRDYSDWLLEHPIKRFPEDMAAYEEYCFDDPDRCDLSAVREALEGVGEKGLVTPYVGPPFTSFLGFIREGGMAQTLFDLLDHETYCRELHGRYVEHCARIAELLLQKTSAQVLFIESGFSAPPMVSPALYRKWDVPVLASVAKICHGRGALLHLHHHGYVFPVIEDIIEAGVDLICPLLPPPQGDVADMRELKRRCAGRIALKGNVDPIGVLLKGTPRDVEEDVRRCLSAAAAGGGYILGTADSTVVGTPFENIHAFVQAGKRYGTY
jgi:hypothetical protein